MQHKQTIRNICKHNANLMALALLRPRYEAESPDESALVVAAKKFGFFFFRRTNTHITVRSPPLRLLGVPLPSAAGQLSVPLSLARC